MILIRSLLLATAAATLIQGCAFVRGNYDDDFKQEDVESIKVRASNRQDVAEILGAPERVIRVHDKEIFHYYNYILKSGTVLFFSRTNVVGNDLYVFLPRRHRPTGSFRTPEAASQTTILAFRRLVDDAGSAKGFVDSVVPSHHPFRRMPFGLASFHSQ
jgi:hypothetical protein